MYFYNKHVRLRAYSKDVSYPLVFSLTYGGEHNITIAKAINDKLHSRTTFQKKQVSSEPEMVKYPVKDRFYIKVLL